ncbi:peptide deformylase, variant [Aphanomyces invadans]|uniref:Peptide deformylase n=1 Tax=Aphanomyces invadans TaxID=157072 RepID=A0A024UEB5_9STRA|nr:peptide deformylase, variant [Aphanomyces invadans]ETW04232.1 peptide deformylase, variant [Aphanomyces invadans]|eukprot:XP_008867188.1 peptide deformylase, variant [Aphanomyces invadans]
MGKQSRNKKKQRAIAMHRLVYLGNSALRKMSVPVKDVKEIVPIVKSMKSIVREYQGLGLAAPQIGVNQRFFLMIEQVPGDEDAEFTYEAVINPVITSASSTVTKDFEGCLSFPGYQGIVPRASEIQVAYTTLDGRKVENRTLTDLHARVFQVLTVLSAFQLHNA